MHGPFKITPFNNHDPTLWPESQLDDGQIASDDEKKICCTIYVYD